jgi:hypothetical protein
MWKSWVSILIRALNAIRISALIQWPRRRENAVSMIISSSTTGLPELREIRFCMGEEMVNHLDSGLIICHNRTFMKHIKKPNESS